MKPMTRTLLAVALLFVTATPWPGTGVAATAAAADLVAADASVETVTSFQHHMQEAHRLMAEKDWPAADGAAGKALEAARANENSYGEFDAAATVVGLQPWRHDDLGQRYERDFARLTASAIPRFRTATCGGCPN